MSNHQSGLRGILVLLIYLSAVVVQAGDANDKVDVPKPTPVQPEWQPAEVGWVGMRRRNDDTHSLTSQPRSA